ncbi:MAG: cell wall hydrolase [Pseudomonadota bacterium]
MKKPVLSTITLLSLLSLAACASHQTTTVAAVAKPGPPAPQPVSRRDVECMALNLYWEARGEGRQGMLAVGWVVLNRVDSQHFPNTVCGVVYQGGERPPCQFSWWCDGRGDRPRDGASWRAAMSVAEELLSDPPPDITRSSLFYHATSIRYPWKRKRVQTAQVGRHIFYR